MWKLLSITAVEETMKGMFGILDNAKLQTSNKCVKTQQTNIEKVQQTQ